MFFPIIIARQSEDYCAPMVGIEHRHFVTPLVFKSNPKIQFSEP
jgi:hypothetical protein